MSKFKKKCDAKISALRHEINIFSLTLLKIFNSVNAGVELGLATPLSTAAASFS